MASKQIKNQASSSSRLSNTFLYLFSLSLSLCLFISGGGFDHWLNSPSDPIYFSYAKEIFQPGHMPRVMFWGESILLPLLVRLLGISHSREMYFYFCGAIAISVLPLCTYLCRQRISTLGTTLFTLLLSASFAYMAHFDFGSQDFLLIFLLAIAALSNSTITIFLSITLACLTHFSITILATISLAVLFWCAPLNESKQVILNKLGSILGGLITGRILLALWFSYFNYLHTNGRQDYVFDKGFNFWLIRYLDAPLDFWITPTKTFLITYLLIFLYFLYRKQYTAFLGAIFSLCIAYAALFLTVDGYRIFATVISGSYIYLLFFFTSTLHLKEDA